jgi:hypothetical protein
MFNNNQPLDWFISMLYLLWGLTAFHCGYNTGRKLNPIERFVIGVVFFMSCYSAYIFNNQQSARHPSSPPRFLEVGSEIALTGGFGFSIGELLGAVSSFFRRRRQNRQNNQQNNTENIPEQRLDSPQ